MVSAYITPLDVQRFRSGLSTSDLIGNSTRLFAPALVGDTHLIISPATTVQLNQYDSVWVFDGPNTERVTVTTTTAIGQTSIPTSALQYAHSTGVVVVSDGTGGSLAQEVIDASDVLETICRQSRFQATFTDMLVLSTEQAAITQDLQLIMKPYNSPIQSVSSVVVTRFGTTVTYDVSSAVIENGGKSIRIPSLLPIGQNASQVYSAPLVQSPAQSVNVTGNVSVTYIAGYAANALPGHIRKGAIYLVCDALTRNQNSGGFQEQMMGKRRIKVSNVGDLSGKSVWRKMAENELAIEVQRAV